MSVYPSAPGGLAWRVARCESGACVMVARHDDTVLFGNTGRPEGPFYSYSLAEWAEFLASAKRGDFDDLT